MQNAAPCERFKRFVDSTNDILKRCGMLELYPVNPFESFLLLCLLSDEPFDLYTDVMEYSYNQTSPAWSFDADQTDLLAEDVLYRRNAVQHIFFAPEAFVTLSLQKSIFFLI